MLENTFILKETFAKEYWTNFRLKTNFGANNKAKKKKAGIGRKIKIDNEK